MARTLFEDPTYVYISLALALAVLAALWHERRDRRLAWAMLAPVAAAMVVFTVERLVVTDREKIASATAEIARAIETRQFGLISRCVDTEFSAQLPVIDRRIKANVVSACKETAEEFNVTKVVAGRMEVDVSGRQAAMRVSTMVHWGPGGRQRALLVWDVRWIKRPDGWKVLEVTDLRQGI